MGLDAILRSGVAIAKSVTASLQSVVSHEVFSSEDEWSNPTYATALSRNAIVERRVKMIRTVDGREILSTMQVTFLEDVTVSVKDRLTVDGLTAPIVSVSGTVDPTTGRGYVTQVALGELTNVA